MNKALLEIYKKAPLNGEDVSYLIAKDALMHIHVKSRGEIESPDDSCVECGLDLRDPIHRRMGWSK